MDSAKPLLVEVTKLHANAQTSADQVMSEVETGKNAIAAAQSSADSLVAAVKGQADTAAAKNAEIEEGRLFAEKSRAEIGEKLSAATAALASLQQQLESAKPLFGEAASLHASAQTTANQTVEVDTKATAVLQSLETLLTTATENVSRITAIKTDTDQAQAAIATKSQYIEDGRVHAEKARGDIDRLSAEAQRSATNAETQHQSGRGTAENLTALLCRRRRRKPQSTAMQARSRSRYSNAKSIRQPRRSWQTSLIPPISD